MTQGHEEGTVKMYNAERGFGFIGRKQGEDVYVHQSAVKRAGLDTLSEGDHVSFTLRQTERGWQAENLQRSASAPTSNQARSSTSSAQMPSRPDTRTDFRFGPDYLRDGYFDEKDGKRYLHPAVIDSTAIDVAKALGNARMKSAQLRRFFAKARGIEATLDRDNNFQAIVADIYGFKRDVAYQVGRRIVPEEFQQFINRNVELAVADEESFRKGFLQHFESVIAYFVYYFRDA